MTEFQLLYLLRIVSKLFETLPQTSRLRQHVQLAIASVIMRDGNERPISLIEAFEIAIAAEISKLLQPRNPVVANMFGKPDTSAVMDFVRIAHETKIRHGRMPGMYDEFAYFLHLIHRDDRDARLIAAALMTVHESTTFVADLRRHYDTVCTMTAGGLTLLGTQTHGESAANPAS